MACVNLTKKQIKILEEAGEEVELAEARLEGKKIFSRERIYAEPAAEKPCIP